MKKIDNCPLCGSENLSDFYMGIDKYFSQREVEFCICERCSFVFLNPMPSKDEYDEMYRKVFQDKRRNLDNVADSIKRLENKKSYEKKIKNLQYFSPFVNEKSRCLEVGGGWGTLAKVVRDKIKCEIDVVEPSELAARTAKEYYRLNVFNQSFDDFYERRNKEKKYDLVFLFHVFEHIVNPNEFLQKAKNLLNKNGKLLLAVPDISNPDQPYEKFFHIEHSYYYSPRTMELMLNKNGFKVDEIFLNNLDFKVVCSPDENSATDLDYNNNEILKFKKILFFYNLKFKILRFFKKIVFVFLSQDKRRKMSEYFSKLFKKIKFIKN